MKPFSTRESKLFCMNIPKRADQAVGTTKTRLDAMHTVVYIIFRKLFLGKYLTI